MGTSNPIHYLLHYWIHSPGVELISAQNPRSGLRSKKWIPPSTSWPEIQGVDLLIGNDPLRGSRVEHEKELS